MHPTSSPTAPALRGPFDLSVGLKKVMASVVIAVCLGAQTYAIVRASGSRWYPFINYPMFSHSHSAGLTYRSLELWARTCGADPQAWQVGSLTLGYEDDHFLGEPARIARDRPAAARDRARLSELAASRLTPRPCVLQVWERTIPTTREGADRAALYHPRRALLREWPVDDPGAVRAAAGR
jgi:hypothetical protein